MNYHIEDRCTERCLRTADPTGHNSWAGGFGLFRCRRATTCRSAERDTPARLTMEELKGNLDKSRNHV